MSGAINDFFASHTWIVVSYLVVILVVLIVLFTISCVHVIRGVNFRFVLLLNSAVLSSIILYAVYTYQHEVA
jgi:hypothetical protein